MDVLASRLQLIIRGRQLTSRAVTIEAAQLALIISSKSHDLRPMEIVI